MTKMDSVPTPMVSRESTRGWYFFFFHREKKKQKKERKQSIPITDPTKARPAREGVFILWFWCRSPTPARKKQGHCPCHPLIGHLPDTCARLRPISASGLLTTVYLCLSVSALYTPQFGNYRVPSYSRRVLFSDSSRWTFNEAIRGNKMIEYIFMFADS